MSSNYEWQKFEANKRIENYRRQADTHRQAKRSSMNKQENSTTVGRAGFALAVGIALLVIGFMLTGCQLGDVPVVEAKSEMAIEAGKIEKSHYQDGWNISEAPTVDSETLNQSSTMSQAERIHFKDQLWEQYESSSANRVERSSVRTMTLADRIRFHDQLQK